MEIPAPMIIATMESATIQPQCATMEIIVPLTHLTVRSAFLSKEDAMIRIPAPTTAAIQPQERVSMRTITPSVMIETPAPLAILVLVDLVKELQYTVMTTIPALTIDAIARLDAIIRKSARRGRFV